MWLMPHRSRGALNKAAYGKQEGAGEGAFPSSEQLELPSLPQGEEEKPAAPVRAGALLALGSHLSLGEGEPGEHLLGPVCLLGRGLMLQLLR